MTKLVLALILLISLFSCTIEKRLYRPGWHIESTGRQNEWKQHHSPEQETTAIQTNTGNASPGEIRTTASEPTTAAASDSLTISEPNEQETPLTATAIAEKPEARVANESVISRQLKRIISKPFKQKIEETGDSNPKQTSPLIITMWVLNIILATAFITLAIVLLSGTSVYPILTTGLFFLFATPIFVIANIILGILAFKQRQNYPNKYRHSNIGLAMMGGLLLMIGGILGVLAVSLLSIIHYIF